MTHIELIEFIYTHRQELDAIYKKQKESASEALENSRLVVRIGDKVELAQSYRHFVDVTLNRIDYAVIFNTYDAELQELLKLKSRYLQEHKSYYLDEIVALLKSIFLKLNQRDQEIRTLLIKVENENALELDLLIEKAMDILEKIEELNLANKKIREIFYGELFILHPKTKSFIEAISDEMATFIENISISLERLQDFIIRTRKLRLQNRQLHQLASQILEERDQALEERLKLNPKEAYLTLHRSQKNRVKTHPDGSESSKIIRKLRRHLHDVQVKKEPKRFTLEAQKEEPLELVNLQRIEEELQEKGSMDIFLTIYEHKELHRFIEASKESGSLKEESFKVYLQFVIPHNPHVTLSPHYNDHNIRIAQWT
jgi:hypothetical protein